MCTCKILLSPVTIRSYLGTELNVQALRELVEDTAIATVQYTMVSLEQRESLVLVPVFSGDAIETGAACILDVADVKLQELFFFL